MKDEKRSAAVNNIEKEAHKDKHLNQYGDQRESAANIDRNPNIPEGAGNKTLTGEENAVQENARKDAEQRSK